MTTEQQTNLRRVLLQALSEADGAPLNLAELHEGARFVLPALTQAAVRDELDALANKQLLTASSSTLHAALTLYTITDAGRDALR